MPPINPVDDPAWNTGLDSKRGDDRGANPAEGEEKEDGKMEVEPLFAAPHDITQEAKDEKKDKVLRQLHTLLLETSVREGKLVCGKCGFEYPIKEGVGNFLLPAHLG